MKFYSVLAENETADVIKDVMKIEGVNQTELAERIGAKRQAVQQMLGRKSQNMRVETMLKLVKALGYDVAITKDLF